MKNQKPKNKYKQEKRPKIKNTEARKNLNFLSNLLETIKKA